ncbi:muconolactone Delta-isomerase family protein [bacterium]|nr:muconolactone Delta-isomerase family protein [bacterium]
MKILALEKELSGATPEKFEPLLKAEARQVLVLQQAGVLREIYFRADRRDAVLILECEDAAHVSAVLGSLPLVQAGLIDFEVIPLVPYTGLQRLVGE